MCLDAAVRDAHGDGCLRDVEAFEGPEHERLALFRRQLAKCPLERRHRVLIGHDLRGIVAARTGRRDDRIVVLAVLAAEEAQDAPTHLAPPSPVTDPVLQDPVEQRPPLRGRPMGVTRGETQHCVLHDVERLVAVPQRDERDPERAGLYLPQKPVKFCSWTDRLLLDREARLDAERKLHRLDPRFCPELPVPTPTRGSR